MSAPAVSVIITSYNRAAYLREAIDSILKQTFSDYEIIIVDDGSADESPKIAEEYAARHDFITFIRQENAGISAARNAGAQRARGEFIAFQDDDDVSHPDRLKRQAESLKEHKDVAACAGQTFTIGYKSGVTKPNKKRSVAMIHSGCMIRRNVLVSLGGYRPFFRAYEDMDLSFRFSEKNLKMHYINDVLYYYRIGNPSTSGSIVNKSPLDNLHYIIAAVVSAGCRRLHRPDPVAENMAMEDIIAMMPDLPADMRLLLLRQARNSGKRLLRRGQASRDAMLKLRLYIDMLSAGECRKTAGKYRRWLALQCLRYGQLNHIKVFLSAVSK